MLNLFENENYRELISSLREIAINVDGGPERESQLNSLLDNIDQTFRIGTLRSTDTTNSIWRSGNVSKPANAGLFAGSYSTMLTYTVTTGP